jgi:hypothetical protein
MRMSRLCMRDVHDSVMELDAFLGRTLIWVCFPLRGTRIDSNCLDRPSEDGKSRVRRDWTNLSCNRNNVSKLTPLLSFG